MKKVKQLPDGIVIPSSTDFLVDVDQYVEKRLSEADVEESTRTDMAISVSELVNNAIIHGNGFDESKTVDVRLNVSSSEIKIVVCDQGTGFDIDEVDDPVENGNLMREVGRGIFIVRNFVDEMNVDRNPTGGTCIEIIKKR